MQVRTLGQLPFLVYDFDSLESHKKYNRQWIFKAIVKSGSFNYAWNDPKFSRPM